MANIPDDICEPGPFLTPKAIEPPNITKATVQRCISKLSPHWDDEQLEAVVSMFKEHGLMCWCAAKVTRQVRQKSL